MPISLEAPVGAVGRAGRPRGQIEWRWGNACISSRVHEARALDAGASAVLAASIFHDAETTVAEVKRDLAALGVPVRLDLQPGNRP